MGFSHIEEVLKSGQALFAFAPKIASRSVELSPGSAGRSKEDLRFRLTVSRDLILSQALDRPACLGTQPQQEPS
jgi:hypothetical protein